MADTVEVQFSHPHDGYGTKQGDRKSLDVFEAKALVRSGYAVYNKVADAKAANASPEQAASKGGK